MSKSQKQTRARRSSAALSGDDSGVQQNEGNIDYGNLPRVPESIEKETDHIEECSINVPISEPSNPISQSTVMRSLPSATSSSVSYSVPPKVSSAPVGMIDMYGRSMPAVPEVKHRFCMTEVDLLQQQLDIETAELRIKKLRLELQCKGSQATLSDQEPSDSFCHGSTGETKLDAFKDVGNDLLKSLILSNGLPKIEVDPFDGTSTKFWLFMKTFDDCVASKLSDEGQKLTYLLHYCHGKAKDAIEHCVLLPKTGAYTEAMSILKCEFGNPHQIMQDLMSEIYEAPVTSSNLEGLRTLVRRMKGCAITLGQMNYSHELNCSVNLLRVIERLPKDIRYKWAERADDLIDRGNRPTWCDLVRFLEKRISVLSSQYGQAARQNDSSSVSPKTHSIPARPLRVFNRTSMAIVSNGSNLNCPLCAAEHKLDACVQFSNLDLPGRREVLRKHKRCFICFNANHMAKSCTASVKCNACGGRHHYLMHRDNVERNYQAPVRQCSMTTEQHTTTRLGFVPIKLKGVESDVVTYAFLDNGSDITLMNQRTADLLGVKGEVFNLRVRTLHGTSTLPCERVSIILESLDKESMINLDSVYVIKRLPIDYAEVPNEVDMKRWPHLSDVQLVRLRSNEVGILIGGNVPEAHWVIEQRVGRGHQPYGVKTMLGWSLRGPSGCAGRDHCVNSIKVRSIDVDSELLKMFEQDFKDVCLGELEHSLDDRKALEKAQASATLVDGHFSIGLPWNNNCDRLQDNRSIALKRLEFLRKRLVRDNDLRNKYFELMRLHVSKGFISKIDSVVNVSSKRWFLPHHPVTNPHKPGKVRIVFDCAATYNGISLNQALLQGPNLTNSLIGVLLRFRRFSVAISSDIADMFLQVNVPKYDRWAMSFLWWNSEDMVNPPDVYESNVHLFGATSSPFCANFALQKTALDFATCFSPSTVAAVREGFYVDDCLISCTTVEEASELVQNLQQLLERGGFHLTKWTSNRPEVLSSVSEENRANKSVNLDLQRCSYQRALGILWDVEKDCLKFKVDLPIKPPTRRGILSTVASLYDPLGFVAPLLMPARSLLQDQCHANIGWDVSVDETSVLNWNKWLANIRSITNLEIPRCLVHHQETELQLHIFADASTKGYGVVAYIRSLTSNEHYSCKFVMGKSRVNPKKFVTVPRLELIAATLAVRLMRSLVAELKLNFSRVTLWTDSAIVLHCINNTCTRFVTFVANRLRQIHEGSDPSQWRHVPSSLNPADLASRGISSANTREMNFWLEGPQFLWNSESDWPEDMMTEQVNIDCLKHNHGVCANINAMNSSSIDNLLSYFSSWFKLQRATAWLARFSDYYSVMKGRHNISLRVGYLSVSELRMAQDNIVRIVQRQYFADELKLMQRIDSGDRTWPKSSSIRNLNPILVDGIIRVGGRLGTSRLGFLSKHPVILPGDHHVSKLIIRHYHESNGHVGLSHTLAAVRKHFWVLKGAATVKRVLRQCMSCRLRFSQVSDQVMANLPEARVLPGDFPFASVGIDYFGPISIRLNRSVVKRYGCLFSCMKTRAVHIEVASNLTVDSFIMALMRFISRRGKPIEIFSDNGTNFVGAEIELKRLISSWNQARLSNEMLQRNIEWNFNPPSASHRGGVWERMIRSVRRILCSVSKEQILSEEVLHTYLTEVERILNDRPLVPVYDDSNVIDVLTPNKLLLLRSSEGLVEGEVDMRSRYTRQWRHSQHLARTFWKRWVTEYIPTLQQRNKWLTTKRDFRVGDMVLIIDGKPDWHSWPKGIVSDVIHNVDGHVRQVLVRTSNGTIHRDIRKVALLEGIDENGAS